MTDFDCTVRDYLYTKLPDLSELTFLQTLIPFGLVYIVYSLGTKDVLTVLIKYLIFLLILRYVYSILKKEPHPSKKKKYNMALSGQFILFILCIFIIADYKLIDFKTVSLFNNQIEINTVVATILIFSYGFLKILTRSNYSVDLLNTYFITYFFYHLRIFGS